MRIPLDAFQPRAYQQAVCDAFEEKGYKKLLIVWPRRSGKDLVAWTLMIREALRRVGNYIYCLPTYQQCKLVIWQSITTKDGKKFPDLIPEELVVKKNESELTIHLINGSIIRLVGSDNYDRSIVGQNAVMFVFSEFALADAQAYMLGARPILAQNDGKVIFVSTPRSKNHFYDLYRIAEKSDDWFCQKLTIEDTKHISIEEIKKDIENGEMSQDLADQEYYCSFEKGQEGTVYGKYIDKLRLTGKVTSVPWDPSYKTHSAWDLGMRDATSIILFQIVGTSVNIIDYYEQTGKGLDHYVRWLQDKEYTWGKHIVPFDIRVRELGTGISRYEKAKQLGVTFTIAPQLSLEDGIEAVRAALPRMIFDESKTKPLVKALESYHYEFDSKRNVYSKTPVHDFSSHGADAMRYLAIALSKLRDGLTAEDIDRNYREAMYGSDAFVPAPFRKPEDYY